MNVANFEEDVGAAALLFLPFVLLFLALWAVAPPSSSQLVASDPLVQLVYAAAGLWAIPLLSVLPALAWMVLSWPSRPALLRAARLALGGAALVGVGLPLLRLVVGPALPAFVPPEESALAGITLGVGAGMFEEAVFRLGILPAAFLLVRRAWPPIWAVAFAVVVTSLAFALSHELGPGAGQFDPRFFATRFVMPGCVMSLLFFWLGPSFLITLHCAAHVGIALLFTGVPSAG